LKGRTLNFVSIHVEGMAQGVSAKQIVQQERIAALEAEIDQLRRSSHQRGSTSERPT
jgi:hypothetical protein